MGTDPEPLVVAWRGEVVTVPVAQADDETSAPRGVAWGCFFSLMLTLAGTLAIAGITWLAVHVW